MTAVFAHGAAASVTLKADYRFHDNHDSSVPGAPPIADVGDGNTFATETVAGCSTRVLAFPYQNGLVADTSGVITSSSKTVVMDFRLADVSSYRRLIGASDVTDDSGLYVLDGNLDWYNQGDGSDHQGTGAPIQPNQFVEVALLQNQITTQFTKIGFVNGVQQFNYTNPVEIGTYPRLFKDNGSSPSDENSAGEAFRISYYDQGVTPADVGQIYSNSLLGNPSTCPAAGASRTGKPKVTKGGKLIDAGIQGTCPDWGVSCNGTASLAVAGAKKSKATLLNSVAFSIPSNLTQEVVFGLRKRGQKLLSKLLRTKGTLKATVSVAMTGPNGKPITLTNSRKLKAQKRG